MQFPESWLREFVDPPVSTGELAEQLTMAGLEVEGVSTAAPGFSGVVAARVERLAPHPRSDRLKVCTVDDGSGAHLSVVCGAENVREDGRYPLARIGAVLPGDIRIGAAAIQGVDSAGMLCSAAELGLYEDASGLYELGEDAKPGVPLQDLLGLDDPVIDVSLTPNRGDCLSLHGLARETAVINGLPFQLPAVEPLEADIDDAREIKLVEPAACPRYCGRIIRDIDAARPTPLKIVERLRRSGIRSINIVVDLTNYVMLECGQPMHAFDDGKLKGHIEVRYAKAGEQLETLDGAVQNLTADTLVIADASGAIAMAGIMGGLPTAVTGDSRSIFLESAFFSPEAVLGRARRYGLHTDASHRFERGVDPTLADRAIERLSHLIVRHCGGKAGPVTEAREQAQLPGRVALRLREASVTRLLGEAVPARRIQEILAALGFTTLPDDGGWRIEVPSFRFDVGLEADLNEEIARVNGYGRIDGTQPDTTMRLKPARGQGAARRAVMRTLVSRDYREAITYSFVDPGLQAMLEGEAAGIPLINPISADMAVLRRSLWPGLLQALLYNLKRQQARIRLFELGQVFTSREPGADEPLIAGVIYGNIYPEQWATRNRSCDFYDLKADVEAILGLSLDPRALVYERSRHPALHPGQAAAIFHRDKELGRLGALHPELAKKLDIPHPVFLFECRLPPLLAEKRVSYASLSKYPSIRRDISIIVEADLPVANVINCIKTAAPDTFHNLELFDVYQGEGIDLGKKSLALGLTFQGTSSTLTDEEADAAVRGILDLLQSQFGAIMRE